ncbi:MAG: ROK family transcriptional regulator [Boseongicola sp.]|nr:ROK family transcriptional regulator [Boseongicola sp.]
MSGSEADPIEITREFETSGSNQSGMRERNERLVLSILRRQGALPKVEIARKTGLSAQTVSVIMRALETDGLLEKGEKLRGKVGQPSVPLRLAPDGAYFLGLKVGRRSAELSLVNFIGEELAHVKTTYSYPTPNETLEFVRSSVKSIFDKLPPDRRSRIAGMGIASPYYLWEWATVIGVDESKMAAWKDCDLGAEVAKMYDFPVYFGNDASCACGAELVFGTAPTPPDFLYIYLGYFVGGGVVLNGSLYTGSFGNAGAIGPFPTKSRDGRDTQLVDVASLIGLERRLLSAGLVPEVVLADRDNWNIDPALIDDWLDEAVPPLARVVQTAVSFIDFPAVLIDGNMPTDLRSKVVAKVAEHLKELDMSGLTVPDIRPGSVGPRARSLGAASLPLSKRFMLET